MKRLIILIFAMAIGLILFAGSAIAADHANGLPGRIEQDLGQAFDARIVHGRHLPQIGYRGRAEGNECP